MFTKLEKEALEQLIDMHSVADVLMAVAEIASEKAEHIRENWQDDVTARNWDNVELKCEKLADSISI